LEISEMGTMGLQRMLSAVAALIGFVCMILFSSILHQKHLASGRYTSSFDLLLQRPHPAYTTLRRNQHLTKQSAFTTHLQEMLSKRRGQLRKRSIENKVQLVFLQQTDRTQPIFRVRSKYLAKQNHHEPDTLSRFKLRKTTSQIRNPCVPNLLVIGAQKAGTTSWY
jgi:hypothetical protein